MTPPLPIVEWPKEFSHVLDRLDSSMHQKFTVMKTDSGHVRRRPTTTPFPIFRGTAILSEAEMTALDELFEATLGRHFSFRNPRTGAMVYATFMRAPFVRSTQIVVGSDTTYQVDLVLRDTTDVIQRSLANSVISSA